LDNILWSIADFVGNLPYLRFTSLSLPRASSLCGRAQFYFGQRYKQGDKLLLPFSITFDHANTDPWVLNLLMENFNRILEMGEADSEEHETQY